jgi:hypothetical protein
MDEFAQKVLDEEAELERKLAAVRAVKAAYGIGVAAATGAAAARSNTTGVGAPARPPRRMADRMDKFGAYGQGIIDVALQFLPGESDGPMPTRDLVSKLERYGTEVRGENKVNALSALLARSSKIKGHGRAGWTLVGERAVQPIIETLGGDGPHKENEPHSDDAGGSDAVSAGGDTLELTQVHSNEGAEA